MNPRYLYFFGFISICFIGLVLYGLYVKQSIREGSTIKLPDPKVDEHVEADKTSTYLNDFAAQKKARNSRVDSSSVLGFDFNALLKADSLAADSVANAPIDVAVIDSPMLVPVAKPRPKPKRRTSLASSQSSLVARQLELERQRITDSIAYAQRYAKDSAIAAKREQLRLRRSAARGFSGQTVAPVVTQPGNAANSGQQGISVSASVYNDQTVKSGGTVFLRTTETFKISGIIIPRNTRVSGIASFSGSRLTVSIKNIRVGDKLIPVNLKVYDMDNMVGINIPAETAENIISQEAENTASGALSGLGGPYDAIAGVGSKLIRNFASKNKGEIHLADSYKLYLIGN